MEREETGPLYPYGDEAACAAQLRRLAEDRQLREALSKRAKEHLARYSLDRVLPEVTALYLSVL